MLNERQREIATKVLALLEEGKSLRSAATEVGEVTEAAIRQWRAADAEFASQYARAREIGYERLADEIIDLSDRPVGGITSEGVQHARLQVDTRKWMLSKVLPKIYGDRVEHEHKGGITVQLTGPEARL